jgi:hypothetical protein
MGRCDGLTTGEAEARDAALMQALRAVEDALQAYARRQGPVGPAWNVSAVLGVVRRALDGVPDREVTGLEYRGG